MAKISRKQALEVMGAAVTPESAEYLFKECLKATGIPDKPEFTPDELLTLSNAMLELAIQQAQTAEQEAVYGELFGR